MRGIVIMENYKTYEQEARIFCNSVLKLAGNENNLQNLESYLSRHFEAWMIKFANSPENIAAELEDFSNMEG